MSGSGSIRATLLTRLVAATFAAPAGAQPRALAPV
jgi:hypothetical protein